MWWLIPIATFALGILVGMGAVYWSIGPGEAIVRRG